MAYSARADIDFIFGTDNVTAWATRDDSDDAADILARVNRAIEESDEEIDDVMRTMAYQVPVVTAAGATPVTIRGLSARLAGVRLYEAYGVQDYSVESGVARHRLSWHWEYAQRILEDIRTGKRKISAV